MSTVGDPLPRQLVVDQLPPERINDVPADGLGPPPPLDDPLRDEARENRWMAASTRLAERDVTFTIASLLGGLLLWEIVARVADVIFFPPITNVFARFWELLVGGKILSDLRRSVTNLLMGFAISSVAGIAVGMLMGRFRVIEKMLDPYVIAFMTAPTVVFTPIYFSIFGLERWSIVFLIVQYSVFIIIVNTVTAVHSVDRELVEMSAVFGAREHQRLFRIVLPASMPLIMAGLRLGMGRAVKGMINGELLIAVVGLGATSQTFARARDAEGVFAVLLVVVIVALLAVKVVEIVDRRINGWLPDAQR